MASNARIASVTILRCKSGWSGGPGLMAKREIDEHRARRLDRLRDIDRRSH